MVHEGICVSWLPACPNVYKLERRQDKPLVEA